MRRKGAVDAEYCHRSSVAIRSQAQSGNIRTSRGALVKSRCVYVNRRAKRLRTCPANTCNELGSRLSTMCMHLSLRQSRINYTDVSAPCATATRICSQHSPGDASNTIRRAILVRRGLRIFRALEAFLYLVCGHMENSPTAAP